MSLELNIGAMIRKYRTEKDWTLKVLSQQTHITSSMLSQIERGLAAPSLNTIKVISQALNIPLFKFFIEEEPPLESPVMKPENRKHIFVRQIDHELLTQGNGSQIEFMQATYYSDDTSDNKPMSHKGEEVVLVTEGALNIDMYGNTYIMEKGDSIRIPSQVPHNFYNPYSDKAVIVFAVTPPEF